MVILEKKLLHEIDKAKSMIDREKLDDYVIRMHHNLMREALINASIQDEDNRQRKNEVIDNFTKTWRYGLENYNGEFSLELLQGLAGKVEPLLSLDGRYAQIRSTGSFGFPGVHYLAPEGEDRIRTHLGRMTDSIERSNMHPVEEAIFLYFHIVRIQPFLGGNKRTANAAMNLTLRYNEYAPITVHPEESDKFARLFLNGISDFKEAGSQTDEPLDAYLKIGQGQKNFYEYFAKKELDNLIVIKDELKGLDVHKINLKVSDPGVFHTVKKKIASWYKLDLPHQEKLEPSKKRVIAIGDVPYKYIESILEELKERNRIRKYEIIPSKRK